jgi:hypothetical protein
MADRSTVLMTWGLKEMVALAGFHKYATNKGVALREFG